MQDIFIYVNISRIYDEIIRLMCAIEISNNNLVAEHMLNKLLIHVFVTSSKKSMKNLLKQDFFAVQQFLMTH